MAGGIFVNQPFHFNPKCVIFGIILMVAYYFLPPKELILLPLIFIVGYIAMAWYDHIYNCDTKLHSGIAPLGMATFDAWGKPQVFGSKDPKTIDSEGLSPLNHGFEDDKLKESVEYVPDQVLAYRRNVNYFHIFGVMLTFIGFALWVNYVFNETRKNNPDVSDEEVKRIASERLIGFRVFIGIFGAMALAFHSYRLFVKQRPLRFIDINVAKSTKSSATPMISSDDNPEYLAGVNMLHIVIGGYMLYIAFDTSVQAYNYLAYMGVFAGAFHAFLLFSKNSS